MKEIKEEMSVSSARGYNDTPSELQTPLETIDRFETETKIILHDTNEDEEKPLEEQKHELPDFEENELLK